MTSQLKPSIKNTMKPISSNFLSNSITLTFRSLLSCIEEIQSIDERNQMFYVEVIRNLSEFIVYGEKFKKNYFDIFCERNTLESFSRILNLNNRFVNMQLIQTSSIFLQNINAMTKKCKERFFLTSYNM